MLTPPFLPYWEGNKSTCNLGQMVAAKEGIRNQHRQLGTLSRHLLATNKKIYTSPRLRKLLM